ncbi:MAG: NAD(P)-dependent oxidoreductase [Tepidisphaeraceae bacterium]
MRIRSDADLDLALSEPMPYVADALAKSPGDILVLGVAGKMGPTLARMATRAIQSSGSKAKVIGVARFSNAAEQAKLEAWGVHTIKGDLLDTASLAKLPDAPNVVYMAGMKFGSTGNEPLTWAMNTHLPALVCQRFAGSRIAAFSTGNIYGLCPLRLGGSLETDAPNPQGEYAMSCLGRERMFEHFAKTRGTKVSILRLNYATELRYGVIHDLARKVAEEREIDLAMGAFNSIWQADANAIALASLAHADSPAFILNIAGPEQLSVKRVCDRIGHVLGKTPVYAGQESSDAILSNAQRSTRLFGYPRVGAEELIDAVAEWVRDGGGSLGRPTHFEARDGKF